MRLDGGEKLLMMPVTENREQSRLNNLGLPVAVPRRNLSCRAEEAGAKKKLPRHNTRPRRQQKPLQA